jgi:hypothetical protein
MINLLVSSTTSSGQSHIILFFSPPKSHYAWAADGFPKASQCGRCHGRLRLSRVLFVLKPGLSHTALPTAIQPFFPQGF